MQISIGSKMSDTVKLADASPTYCAPASTHSHQQQQNKKGCASTTVVKFVKWRSVDKDKNDELYKYVSFDRGQNVEDTISIPMHPENVLFQEMYHHVQSKSPYRIIFRYIGTDPESGETCRNFSHYNKVNCADFTRKFTNVQSMFQIISQLPAVQDMIITLTHENLLVSKAEAAQLRNSEPKKYECTSLKRLVIYIAKWDDVDPVALVEYEKLRLNAILKYAHLCCPNLESIRIMNDENQPTTACFKTLKMFRETLHDNFMYATISYEPTKKKQPPSNATDTGDKEKAENVATVPQNHEEAVADNKKQEDPTTQSNCSSKLRTPISSPNISGSNGEEEEIPTRPPRSPEYIDLSDDSEDEQHPVVQPPSTSVSSSRNQRVSSAEGGGGASEAETVCTEPIHSVADMEVTEDNEFNEYEEFDYSEERQDHRPDRDQRLFDNSRPEYSGGKKSDHRPERDQRSFGYSEKGQPEYTSERQDNHHDRRERDPDFDRRNNWYKRRTPPPQRYSDNDSYGNPIPVTPGQKRVYSKERHFRHRENGGGSSRGRFVPHYKRTPYHKYDKSKRWSSTSGP